MTFSCSIQVKQALKATLEDLYKNKYKVNKKSWSLASEFSPPWRRPV